MSNTVLENFFCSSISGDAFSLFIESFIINNIYHLIKRLTNNYIHVYICYHTRAFPSTMRFHGNQKRGLHVDWFGTLGASKQVAGVFVQIRMYIHAQLW